MHCNGGMGDVPQQGKTKHHDHSKKSDAPMLSLEENLNQTVKKSSEPQEPFEKSRREYGAHDSDIHDLSLGR